VATAALIFIVRIHHHLLL